MSNRTPVDRFETGFIRNAGAPAPWPRPRTLRFATTYGSPLHLLPWRNLSNRISIQDPAFLLYVSPRFSVPSSMPLASFRRSSYGWLFTLLVLLAAPCEAVQAQSQEQLGRYQLAERYLRAGQFDRAITLLQDLYAQSPETQVFYSRLKEAYEQSKRYDDALALVDERMERQQPAPVMLAERARLLHLRGDEEAAMQTYDEAIALAPESRSTYLVVYHSLTQNRLFTKAIDVLEQGRERMGDDGAFQSALAQLYSLSGMHEQAMQEYANWLRDDDRKLGLVRSRISRFVEQKEAREAYAAVLERAVQDEPLYRPFRELLAWLYVESGRYRDALDVVRAIDRLENEQGRALFEFANQVSHAGAYDVATDAYQEILDRYPEAPVAPEALVGLGLMQERRAERDDERAFDASGTRTEAPHYDAALAAYRSFLQQHPHHPRYPAVLRRIGRLQQDVFFDLGEAEATLEEVAQRYSKTEAANEARYDLGRIALMRGRLDEARLAFSRLVEELRTGELAERARFELALLHFYQGNFESASGIADVLDANTSTDVANDAIELKVLIQENKGPDSLSLPLQRYAQARLLQRQRQPSRALDSLDALLADYGNHPLADDSRFLRASTLDDAGRPNEAVAAFLELPLIHPQSPLADRSLYQAARLQEHVLNEPERALDTYTRLLTDYAGSMLIPDARARIRVLRGDTAS